MDGAIGELSPFHHEFGYYAHGVHDLAFSKLAAGWGKDIEFIRELLEHHLINRGKHLRLIESEENEELKGLLVRN